MTPDLFHARGVGGETREGKKGARWAAGGPSVTLSFSSHPIHHCPRLRTPLRTDYIDISLQPRRPVRSIHFVLVKKLTMAEPHNIEEQGEIAVVCFPLVVLRYVYVSYS
jgi:hypothetical protein